MAKTKKKSDFLPVIGYQCFWCCSYETPENLYWHDDEKFDCTGFLCGSCKAVRLGGWDVMKWYSFDKFLKKKGFKKND